MPQVVAYFDETGLGGNLGSLDDWAGVVASLEDVPAEGYKHLHHLVENGWEDDLPALEDEIAECLEEHTKGEAHETLEELLDAIESRGEDDEAVALGLDDGSTLNIASLASLLVRSTSSFADNANPGQPRGDDGRFMEASRHELLQAIKRGFGPLMTEAEVSAGGKASTDEEDEAEEEKHSPEAVMESLPSVNNLVLNSLETINCLSVGVLDNHLPGKHNQASHGKHSTIRARSAREAARRGEGSKGGTQAKVKVASKEVARSPKGGKASEKAVIDTIKRLEPNASQGVTVLARDLKKALPKGSKDVDEVVISMAEKGVVHLHRADNPSLFTAEEKKGLIHDRDSNTYFIAVGLRPDY